MQSQTHNPYSPPNANIKPSKDLNPSAIGLTIGFWFASPLMLAMIVMLRMSFGNGKSTGVVALVMSAFLVTILLTIIFGWWWGRLSSKVTFARSVRIVLMQGTCLLISFYSNLTLAMLMDSSTSTIYSYEDLEPTLIAWVVCCVWMSLIGLVVRWRIRKLRSAGNNIDDVAHS